MLHTLKTTLKDTAGDTLGNKERETGSTEMCEDPGQGLAKSPCPWTRGLPCSVPNCDMQASS